MTDKAFVVMETGYEYNDEYHSVHESNDGVPVAVLLSKEEAEKDARARIVNDFLKGWAGKELHGFGCEGIQSVFKRMPAFLEAEGMIEDIFFQHDAPHAWDINTVLKIDERSDEELEEIADSMEFLPFYVQEVPLGQAV